MSKVAKLRKIGVEDTFSIEMKAPYHNYIIENGIVSANSHSAAYALLAYQMAYLKAHFPIEFMAAQLTCTIKDPKFFPKYLSETKKMGIKILPPDINKSKEHFTIEGDSIRFGLEAIRDIGHIPAKELAAAAPFQSLEDIIKLTVEHNDRNLKVANKKVLTALTFTGALSSFGNNPIDIYIELMKLRKDKFDETELRTSLVKTPMQEYERNYLSTNILYNPLLGIAAPIEWNKLKEKESIDTIVIVDSIHEIKTAKGNDMAILELITLEDTISAALFPDLYQRHKNIIPGTYIKIELVSTEKGYFIRDLHIPKKLNKHLITNEEEIIV